MWLAALLAALALPLLLAQRAVGLDADRGVLVELSLITGLLAMVLIVAAVWTPSRLRRLSRAIGVERLIHWHRAVGIAATVAVIAHVVLVVAVPDRGWALTLLWPPTAPSRARAATAATVAIVLMVAVTLGRRRLNLPYGLWRTLHGLLAATVVIGTALHIYWLNHLIAEPAMRALFIACGVLVCVLVTKRWIVNPPARPAHLVRRA